MKGTKLWQAPGSPVIQGQSRNRRPFLNVWLLSVAAAAGVLLGGLVLFAIFPGQTALSFTDALATSLTLLAYAAPGVVAGTLLGTAFSRTIGTRRAWLGGCLGGVVLGAVAIGVLATNITLRGITFS